MRSSLRAVNRQEFSAHSKAYISIFKNAREVKKRMPLGVDLAGGEAPGDYECERPAKGIFRPREIFH